MSRGGPAISLERRVAAYAPTNQGFSLRKKVFSEVDQICEDLSNSGISRFRDFEVLCASNNTCDNYSPLPVVLAFIPTFRTPPRRPPFVASGTIRTGADRFQYFGFRG